MWAAWRVYPRERPQTKDWHYDSPNYSQMAYPRRNDVYPDTKGKRYGWCEERQKGASKDAGFKTKQDIYSAASAYVWIFMFHYKLWSKHIQWGMWGVNVWVSTLILESCFRRTKKTYMKMSRTDVLSKILRPPRQSFEGDFKKFFL